MPWIELASGCDKRFYVEQSGEGGYGAICCSDEVASREFKAYVDLKNIGVTLLPTILPWTDPAGILVDGQTLMPKYQIQRLKIERTFKPQMCAFEVPPKTRKLLAGGNRELLLAGLQEIDANLARICGIVGELTLAVNKDDGRLYMLDFSPGADGSRALSQIQTIKTGLQNLQAALN